jgi:hypothetical protein
MEDATVWVLLTRILSIFSVIGRRRITLNHIRNSITLLFVRAIGSIWAV